MRHFLPLIALTTAFGGAHADDLSNRKTYECRYLENAPYGVTAWLRSEMVKTETGKESRFVPYNSDAAKGLILDATTSRDIASSQELQDRETSFYMAYNAKGWYIFIHCREPNIQTLVDEGKDISLEMFFSPGLERVPYYQMIVRQVARRVNHYDWGMPHRHYRSLKDSVWVESLVVDTGVATFVFIPWSNLYDRLPLSGEYWRFSLMRWGGPSVTWGGKVHDTGNFGLIRFQPPNAKQRLEIEKRILRAAWSKFRATAKEATRYWSDQEVGDLEFFNETLQPEIVRLSAFGESLGEPDTWNAEVVQKGRTVLADWMEFQYKVAELRTHYLMDKRFEEGG